MITLTSIETPPTSFDVVFPELLQHNYLRNSWMQFENIEVYIRIVTRNIDNKRQYVVEIANIGEPRKDMLHVKGVIDRLIAAVEARCNYPIIFENVLNPAFVEALQRRGFKILPERTFPGATTVIKYQPNG